MNDPEGFTLRDGRVVAVDPWRVFFDHASLWETPHMVVAAYMVVGFGVASVYATGYLRGRRDRYHRLGFALPFAVGAALAPVQILLGDTAAREVAQQQPVKFATMEYVARTARGVPEILGGFYSGGRVHLGLSLPDIDSLLVGFSTHTQVVGWDSVPASERPPAPTLIHLAFNAMVSVGFLLLLAAAWALIVCGGDVACRASRSSGCSLSRAARRRSSRWNAAGW